MGLFDDDNSSVVLLPKEAIPDSLRNCLWTLYYSRVLEISRETYIMDRDNYLEKLWTKYFKQAIDSLPSGQTSWGSKYIEVETVTSEIRKHYFALTDWKKVYTILEFTFPYLAPPSKSMFSDELNTILTEERSPLRFIENHFIEITDELELAEIQKAVSTTKSTFTPVYTHLNASIEYLADANENGYRNSIKESISAVESLCKILTNDEKGTLASALKKLNIHKALEKALLTLYGFTSDASGIRHSLGFGDDVADFNDAKFMLVSCSSFVNYLKAKME